MNTDKGKTSCDSRSRRRGEHESSPGVNTGRNADVCGEPHMFEAGTRLGSKIVRRHPKCRWRRASGAFDNSPQFQLRVRGTPTQLAPTGRLRFGLAQAVGGLDWDWFSRPCGADGVGHTPPAVETAGYCQFVPVGRKTSRCVSRRFLSGGWAYSPQPSASLRRLQLWICVHRCPSVVEVLSTALFRPE